MEVGTIFAWLLSGVSVWAAKEEVPRPPNIILIMADDLQEKSPLKEDDEIRSMFQKVYQKLPPAPPVQGGTQGEASPGLPRLEQGRSAMSRPYSPGVPVTTR